MSKAISLLPLMTLGILVLGGCSNTAEQMKEQFNFSKKPPDEFAVVKRAPLEMPPDYSLRPPQPGAPRPQELTPTEEARVSIVGQTASPSRPIDAATKGEALLLQKTGAAQANPNIRTLVDQETDVIAEDEKTGIDVMKEMIGKDVKEPAQVVDPKGEIERLKSGKTNAPTPSKTSK
ncbi:MAG: DUF3035 domain-containing protein [Alphaproteobacteria bacterium]|nr:DUF3035 domain-containing protein [Alphaproteobacteria bacterium]